MNRLCCTSQLKCIVLPNFSIGHVCCGSWDRWVKVSSKNQAELWVGSSFGSEKSLVLMTEVQHGSQSLAWPATCWGDSGPWYGSSRLVTIHPKSWSIIFVRDKGVCSLLALWNGESSAETSQFFIGIILSNSKGKEDLRLRLSLLEVKHQQSCQNRLENLIVTRIIWLWYSTPYPEYVQI